MRQLAAYLYLHVIHEPDREYVHTTLQDYLASNLEIARNIIYQVAKPVMEKISENYANY